MSSPYVGTIAVTHAETARHARARELAEQRYEREQGPRPEPVTQTPTPGPRRPLRVVFEGAKKPAREARPQTPATTPPTSRDAAPSPTRRTPGEAGEVGGEDDRVVLTRREWQAVERLIDAQPDPKPLRVMRGERPHQATFERY